MGNLYIAATPIGNLDDITLRAAKHLLAAPIIVAESASKAGILLKKLKEEFPQISSVEHKIISFSEDEEMSKIPQIIKMLDENDIVLISEAGTPLVSDPGFLLVREALKRGVNLIPLPGPTAVTAALSASGLPTDKFLFLGFLPKQDGKKTLIFTSLKESFDKFPKTSTTIVVYESPRRIFSTLEVIYSIFGNVDVVVARELTKIHEEFIRAKAGDLATGKIHFVNKGEMTLLFNPNLI